MNQRERDKYLIRHQLVVYHRGPASARMCKENCGWKAEQWAHIHDTDPEDVNNYKPLCRACHVRYDFSTCVKGHDTVRFGRLPMGGCRVCNRIQISQRCNRSVCDGCGYIPKNCKCINFSTESETDNA